MDHHRGDSASMEKTQKMWRCDGGRVAVGTYNRKRNPKESAGAIQTMLDKHERRPFDRHTAGLFASVGAHAVELRRSNSFVQLQQSFGNRRLHTGEPDCILPTVPIRAFPDGHTSRDSIGDRYWAHGEQSCRIRLAKDRGQNRLLKLIENHKKIFSFFQKSR